MFLLESFDCGDEQMVNLCVILVCVFFLFRADAVRRAYGGSCIQMKLSYSPLAPIFLFLMNWMGCGCGYSLPSYLGLLQVLVYKVCFACPFHQIKNLFCFVMFYE